MALALPAKRGDARESEHTDMIVCARCGAANEPSSKFCPSCGASLATAGSRASEAGNAAPLPPLPPLGPPGPAAPGLASPGLASPGLGGPGGAAASPLGLPPLGGPPPAFNPPPFWAPPGGANAPVPPLAPLPEGRTGIAQGFGQPDDETARHRIGAPEGLNPFSATVSPQSLAADGISPFSPFLAPQPSPAPAPSPAAGAPAQAPLPALPFGPTVAQGSGFGAPASPNYGAPPSPTPGFGATPAHSPSQPPFGAPGFAPSPAFGEPPAAFGASPAPAPNYAPPAPSPQYAAPAPAPHYAPPAPAAGAFPPSPQYSPAPAAGAFSPAPHYSPPAPAGGFAPVAPQAPRLDPPTAEVRGAASAGRDPEAVEPGALRVLAGFLVSFEYELGVFWPLYQGINVVGRRDAAPGLDVQIDHPTTSSRHAIIYASARPGRLKVEDTGSTNGTQLGDVPLERGKKYELRDGDTLRFGGYGLIVKLV